MSVNKCAWFVVLLVLATLQIHAQDRILELKNGKDRLWGPDVEYLQKFLLWSGMDIGKDGVDGWFGNDTRKALVEWQKHQGLSGDGKVQLSRLPAMTFRPLIEPWTKALPTVLAGTRGHFSGDFPVIKRYGSLSILSGDDGWRQSLVFGDPANGRTALTATVGEFALSADQRYLVVVDNPGQAAEPMQAIAIADLLAEQSSYITPWAEDAPWPLPAGQSQITSLAIEILGFVPEGCLLRLRINGSEQGVWIVKPRR